MAKRTKSDGPSLTDVLTPEEYDTLVALKTKADALVEDRVIDYIRATKSYGPKSKGDISRIEYKGRERDGRDPLGRYDIEVFYPDDYGESYGSQTSAYVPSAILWDPAGATGKTLEAIEAERAELVRLAEEVKREAARKQSEYEQEQAARLAKKYGYVKAPKKVLPVEDADADEAARRRDDAEAES